MIKKRKEKINERGKKFMLEKGVGVWCLCDDVI